MIARAPPLRKSRSGIFWNLDNLHVTRLGLDPYRSVFRKLLRDSQIMREPIVFRIKMGFLAADFLVVPVVHYIITLSPVTR